MIKLRQETRQNKYVESNYETPKKVTCSQYIEMEGV